MKKWTCILIILLVVTSFVSIAFAGELDEANTAGTTEVSTNISESYTVTIPADITIPYGAESTNLGNVTLVESHLADGKIVAVSVSSLNNWFMKTTQNDTLAYVLKTDGAAYTGSEFEDTNDTDALTVDIAKEAWVSAAAGEYADTITFTIACREK